MGSGRPPALRVFKVVYWAAVVSLPLLAAFMEKEIEESEGRVELNLDDRKRR
jgi:hypothetical protein